MKFNFPKTRFVDEAKEKEKQLPNFKKIVFALEDLIKEFKKRGYEMTSEEITEGFKEVNNG